MNYNLFFDVRDNDEGSSKIYPTLIAADGSKLVSSTGFKNIGCAAAVKSGFDLCQSIEDVGGFEMMREEVEAKKR